MGIVGLTKKSYEITYSFQEIPDSKLSVIIKHTRIILMFIYPIIFMMIIMCK